MNRNSIMIDLEDPRSEKIAGVLTNKTSKKILSLLAEKEMSGSEISEHLALPLNTVGYNLKNLVEAGLIEKSKRMFWSSRGKRIELYTVSNKKIIISPKSMVKGLLPAILATGVIAFIIKLYAENQLTVSSKTEVAKRAADFALEAGQQAAESAASAGSPSLATLPSQAYNALNAVPDYWAWFLLGGLTALLVFLLWNWKRF